MPAPEKLDMDYGSSYLSWVVDGEPPPSSMLESLHRDVSGRRVRRGRSIARAV
ncbi:MAG: hypothetical protein AVDCRST_MAG93-1637 [uncultured Chloroflexia bacterium]|uniref:Uncharacterized protein n=1 Tax=uncultured Chloroflexia bacterium TaxID=1672391 RepID=A0A6J4IE90_9CHLR|nr:MAG: hypothetical protein AVDCRST_MAG93-1637 [uncultured Chloroflexia bacterium]